MFFQVPVSVMPRYANAVSALLQFPSAYSVACYDGQRPLPENDSPSEITCAGGHSQQVHGVVGRWFSVASQAVSAQHLRRDNI
jgi:hypothetical protein